MAEPLLLIGLPLLRQGLRLPLPLPLRLPHHRHAIGSPTLCSWCTMPDDNIASSSTSQIITTVLSARDPPKHPRYWGEPDYRKWKDNEAEILKDIEPITSLAKEIIHSSRYMNGERLTAEDENTVVERLLAYHPHSEDKTGCGLDSIMVDRHPQFRHSRCLFVVRTDGGWIDFSYQKCLRAYIRDEYPSHAKRFIKEHFKRGSS